MLKLFEIIASWSQEHNQGLYPPKKGMEFSSRMEEELKCPACRRLVVLPVVLTACCHCVCLDCASRIQMPLPMPLVSTPSLLSSKNLNDSGIISNCPSASRVALNSAATRGPLPTTNSHSAAVGSKLSSMTIVDVDETTSILSETDSGVMCSRPESYVGTSCASFANLSGVCPLQTHHCGHQGPPQLSSGVQAQVAITCPLCSKVTYSDERGSHSLPKAKTLATITSKYRDTRHLSIECQLCQESQKRQATKMCEPCELFMCDECQLHFHTLEQHNMLAVQEALLKLSCTPLHCFQHPEQRASMFCSQCRTCVCDTCTDQQTPNHHGHRLLPLSVASKSHKVRPFVFPLVRPFVCPLVCPFDCPFVCPLIFPFVCPSVFSFFSCLFYLLIYLPVCLFVFFLGFSSVDWGYLCQAFVFSMSFV